MLPMLFLAAALAQQPLSESIEVRVLEIEAAVVDRNGNAVEGLTRDDFEVKVDGKKRTISNFFAVRRSAIVEETRESAPAAPREVAATTTIPTSLVIFVDDTRLHQRSKARALDALEKYVRTNVGHHTTATLIRYNGSMHVRVRPTERPGHLINEIEAMRKEPASVAWNDRERASLVTSILKMLTPLEVPMAGAAAIGAGEKSEGGGVGAGMAEIFKEHDKIWRSIEAYAHRETSEVERTLEALHDTIGIAAGFEGRKILLYVSEGLPLSPGIELIEFFTRVASKSPDYAVDVHKANFGLADAMRYDRTQQFQHFAKAAQRANVSFYSFDAAGVRTFYIPGTEFIMSTEMPSAQIHRDSDQGGVRLVAAETGGRFLGNDNDLDRVLATMSEQFTTYYSLGIRQEAKMRGVNIDVRVKNRPELRVIAARRRVSIPRDEQVKLNVRSRLYTKASENPLNATLAVAPPVSIDKRCVAAVTVNASPITDVAHVHMAVLNERNDESDVRTEVVPGDGNAIAHTFKLSLRPQKHVLSVAIVDRASGAVSYLQQDVDGSPCK